MAIKYTWDCKTVDTYPTASNATAEEFNDVVFQVHYKLTASDTFDGAKEEYTVIGSTNIDTSDLKSDNFTSFDSITQSAIQAWTVASLGPDDIAVLKQSASGSLIEKVKPTIVTKIIG